MNASPSDAFSDRALGAFIGLAAGDAVGTTVEFKPRGSFKRLHDMVGGGPFGLAPGQWTDDTSMAVCLAESLIAFPELDPHDLMARFEAWMTRGVNSPTGTCFDVGVTTGSAIRRFQRNGEPLAGPVDPNSAGNGSIMRLSPVVLRWWRQPTEAERIAALQSRTTHGATEAVDACALLARALCGLITGEGKAALQSDDPAWSPKIRMIGQGAYRDKTEREISSSGYVVHTLEAAFWVIDRADDFETATLAAANLGDDADTVAAVTGQLAGALWGHSGIPQHWRERLHDHERLLTLGKTLFDAGAA